MAALGVWAVCKAMTGYGYTFFSYYPISPNFPAILAHFLFTPLNDIIFALFPGLLGGLAIGRYVFAGTWILRRSAPGVTRPMERAKKR